MIAFATDTQPTAPAVRSPSTAEETTSAPAGDRRQAFERAALQHVDFLYRFGLRLSGKPAVAEDLVQETMLKACRSWERFDPTSNVRAWLATILRNTFINEYRRRRREVDSLSVETLERFAVLSEGQEVDPEGNFFDQIVDDEVVEAIDALPREYKEALLLSDVHDLPYATIARRVGAPLGTVKSRVHRARQALQRTLQAYATEMGYIRPQPPLAMAS
jgi:RNA polymerase sigma-70 factor (ECF subfamily)